MAGLLRILGFASLTTYVSFIVLVLVVKHPPIKHNSPSVEVPRSARRLSYEIRGDTSQPNVIIWLHGVISSRYEVLAINEEALRGARAYVVSFDRPGYGESTPHKGRTYASSVEDILTVADALKIDKFFVAGVSTGASFAFAIASMAPARVRGVLTLSAAGSYNLISAEARAEDLKLTGGKLAVLRRMCREYPIVMDVLLAISDTYIGGRLMWISGMNRQIMRSVDRISAPDRKCALQPPAVHFTTVLPEAMKQGTTTSGVSDLHLLWNPWSFNITEQIPERLARATHMYHGARDKVAWPAYSEAYKRMLPAASLEIVENAFHFHYWVCDPQRQKAIFKKLIDGGLPA